VPRASSGCGIAGNREIGLKSQFRRLRPLEQPAADLGKFRYQFVRMPAAERRGIYLGGQQDGRCHISTALQAESVESSWKFNEFGKATAYTTVANRVLINTLQIV